jgi:hypothetical protein
MNALSYVLSVAKLLPANMTASATKAFIREKRNLCAEVNWQMEANGDVVGDLLEQTLWVGTSGPKQAQCVLDLFSTKRPRSVKIKNYSCERNPDLRP